MSLLSDFSGRCTYLSARSFLLIKQKPTEILYMKYATVLALVASQAVQGVEIRKSNSQLTSFAQEFVNDFNHTCDFAHRRMADPDQPRVVDLIADG
jgi:hypothetical protein